MNKSLRTFRINKISIKSIGSCLLIVLFGFIIFCGCLSQNSPWKYSETSNTVMLKTEISNTNLSFGSKGYIIKVESKQFFEDYKQNMMTYPNQTAIQESITKIQNNQMNGYITVIDDDQKLPQVDRIVVDLISQGKAEIRFNNNSETIDSVKIADYINQCGPTCGYTGQKVTTQDGKVIFDRTILVL